MNSLLKYLVAVIAAAAVPLGMVAQNVDLELSGMSEGSFYAFTTEVEGADEKLAYEEFKQLMKEYGGKAKRSKPERTKVEAVTINSIGGTDPLDVFADFSERGSQTKVYLWIKQRGDYLSDDSADRDVDNATALLQEFHLRLRRAAIQQELDEEERQLGRVDKKLRNLERDYAGYERDIERAKAAIERAEANIEKNLAAQDETRNELAQQAEAVEAVKEKLAGVKG